MYFIFLQVYKTYFSQYLYIKFPSAGVPISKFFFLLFYFDVLRPLMSTLLSLFLSLCNV